MKKSKKLVLAGLSLLALTGLLALAGCKHEVDTSSGGGQPATQPENNSPQQPTGYKRGETLLETVDIGGKKYDKTKMVVAAGAATTATGGVFGGGVTLQPFALGAYEVTQELYAAVIGGEATQRDLPQSSVSWYQAAAFCNLLTEKTLGTAAAVYYSDAEYKAAYTMADAAEGKAAYRDSSRKGYRLPDESEWEFAARGGNQADSTSWGSRYSGGTEAAAVMVFGAEAAAPVGSKAANSLGLHDMSGNLFEWCGDEAEGGRVLRGGSYAGDAEDNLLEYGGVAGASYKHSTAGFRLCRSL